MKLIAYFFLSISFSGHDFSSNFYQLLLSVIDFAQFFRTDCLW